MRKIILILVLVLLTFVGIFYILKKDEVDNILSQSNTKIEVSNSVFLFQDISSKDSLTHDFYIKNTDNKDLLLKNVLSNCECTVVDFDKRPIQENDSVRIRVKFKPDVIGMVEKNVVVEANTVPPFTVLTLKGNVIK